MEAPNESEMPMSKWGLHELAAHIRLAAKTIFGSTSLIITYEPHNIKVNFGSTLRYYEISKNLKGLDWRIKNNQTFVTFYQDEAMVCIHHIMEQLFEDKMSLYLVHHFECSA